MNRSENRIEALVRDVSSSTERKAIFTALGLVYDLKPEERQSYAIILNSRAGGRNLLYAHERESLRAMIEDWDNQPPHARLIFMLWMQRIVCHDFCVRTAESA